MVLVGFSLSVSRVPAKMMNWKCEHFKETNLPTSEAQNSRAHFRKEVDNRNIDIDLAGFAVVHHDRDQ